MSLLLQDCVEKRGEFVGSACGPHGPYVPDVLFWCVLLFFSTVFMSAFLKEFKFSNYFPTRVQFSRSNISPCMCCISSYCFYPHTVLDTEARCCGTLWWSNTDIPLFKKKRKSFFFFHFCLIPRQVRATISDFAVFFTIVTMVLVDYALGIPSPKLKVPSVFKVSKGPDQR